MSVFFEVAWFSRLFAGCNRFTFGLKVLGKALFKLFSQAAIVHQAKELGTVHSVKTMEQRALEKIFVLHDVPRRCRLHGQRSIRDQAMSYSQ